MTKIDIVSGFLGAGKTTLIKKLLQDALAGSKVVLIENEFGEIGIDSGFLKDAGIEIKEMNSGCICCSLVGDFGTSLREVLDTYHPERILIEPSGVGKLSDVKKAVEKVGADAEVALNSAVAVVDAKKCKMYIKNFGEFFLNQIEHAGTIVLSRTNQLSEEKLSQCVNLIRKYNQDAAIITTPWDEINGKIILETIEHRNCMEEELRKEVEEKGHCCCHGQEGHGHHEHSEGCGCGCHGQKQEGHHHAEEIFDSIGIETPSKYSIEEIRDILGRLENEAEYGFVLRAKGMLPSHEGEWIYFDYVPGEIDIRSGQPEYTGKLCMIGSKLQAEKLRMLFQK